MLLKLKKNEDGFTLVELLVTVTITSLLMSVVIFNYGTFTDNLALSSAEQEIAIAIRQAQTYGLNVKEVTVGGGEFGYAYGIFFDPTDNNTNKHYYIFADKNGDKKYDVGNGCGNASTECVEKFTLRDGIVISGVAISGSACVSLNAARTLHVTFLRPNPNADINFLNNGSNIVCVSQPNAQVILTSLKLKIATITIEATGQIYVQ